MPTIKNILSNKNLFLFGLVLVIVGMTMSRFVTSLGQFILLGNWIIEGDWKRKWQVMKTSRVLWVMCSFYLLHLVGLLWTSDFDYAQNDLRVKLPLLWFPLLFITSDHKFSKKEITNLLWLFTTAVLAASLVCTMVWLGLTKKKVVDIRDISIFNSHIRFALMIDLVICFLLYDFFKSGKWYLYLIKMVLIVWLISFLGIMQSFTGIVVLSIVLSYQAMMFLKKLEKPAVKTGVFALILLLVSFCVWVLIKEIKQQQIPIKQVVRLTHTPSGNLYYNELNNTDSENGNLLFANVCSYELEQEWNKRSQIKFRDRDKKGNEIAMTLLRYLASKGLSKDSTGVSKLSLSDILWIQKGKSNYLYTNRSGFETRIHETLYEYDSWKKGKNPTGHSFLMRLEFWKNGFEIIKRKWLYGVGTGDNLRAYNNQYNYANTELKAEWRLRSHNQFMAVTISFGIIGLILFIIYLFYPAISIKNKHYLFSSLFIIFICSMLNEDTLETQAGVTFFGFFYCLLLNQGSDSESLNKHQA